MWNCCFFSSVTFLYIFSFSNTFFRIFSPPSWISNRHVCQRSPRKKKKKLALIHQYLSIFYALSLFTVFWEIGVFIHQIVFCFCLVLNNHGFQFFILSILPSNLLLKQNIDHVQYLLWEYLICKLFNCINIL